MMSRPRVTRREFLRACGLGATAAVATSALGGIGACQRRATQPNLLFIFSD